MHARIVEIIYRLDRGESGAAIARTLGISRERVRQIVWHDAGRRLPRQAPLSRDESAERFWSRVRRTETCWWWEGKVNPATGYGQMGLLRREGSGGYAHRAAYLLVKGPIGAGLTLDHLCRNRRCVNPDHLEAVSSRINTLRSPLTLAGINARKTHCKHGHEFTPENTGLDRRGRSRHCLRCAREWAREHRKRSDIGESST
jgi:hypothetical protein